MMHRVQSPEAQSRADRGKQKNECVGGGKPRMPSAVPGQGGGLVVTHWALEPDCLDLHPNSCWQITLLL